MNPADPKHPWQRLAAAARRANEDRDTAAPYGFATRVAAQSMAQEPTNASLFARFSLRALGIACLLMVTAFAANYSLITAAPVTEDDSGTLSGALSDDPVAEVLDITS
jgi:hypothetical protein